MIQNPQIPTFYKFVFFFSLNSCCWTDIFFRQVQSIRPGFDFGKIWSCCYACSSQVHFSKFWMALLCSRVPETEPWLDWLFRDAISAAKKATKWGIILGSLGRQGNPSVFNVIICFPECIYNFLCISGIRVFSDCQTYWTKNDFHMWWLFCLVGSSRSLLFAASILVCCCVCQKYFLESFSNFLMSMLGFKSRVLDFPSIGFFLGMVWSFQKLCCSLSQGLRVRQTTFVSLWSGGMPLMNIYPLLHFWNSSFYLRWLWTKLSGKRCIRWIITEKMEVRSRQDLCKPV